MTQRPFQGLVRERFGRVFWVAPEEPETKNRLEKGHDPGPTLRQMPAPCQRNIVKFRVLAQPEPCLGRYGASAAPAAGPVSALAATGGCPGVAAAGVPGTAPASGAAALVDGR